MSESLLLRNLAIYSLQIALLIATAAMVPALVRLRNARAKLAYWHILLAACLLLPFIQPWQRDAPTGDVQISSLILATQPAASHSRAIPWPTLALLVVATGIIARLIWLAAGFRRLHLYRQHSQKIDSPHAAELRICDEISGPVTFGWRRPVVLLPARFQNLDRRIQDAILCHELLHVERRDWLFTLAEELIRAIYWFHPAIWWLLGEIQLAREQAVDAEVIERTRLRDEYVEALLTIAGQDRQADLALAPLFLKKRHLKQRLVSILKEVRMSRTKLISAFAGSMCILAAACWLITAALPLAAAPQNDAPGVTVDLGGATILHRAPVAYPDAIREKGIQGDVSLEARLDSSGNVSDARVLSGPEELHKPALESVLQWHFTHDSADLTRQVTIGFHSSPETANEPSSTSFQQNNLEGRSIRVIKICCLSDAQRDELMSRLPLHEGDTFTADRLVQATRVVKDYDEHLTLTYAPLPNNTVGIVILTPNAVVGEPSAGTPPKRIRVGGNVQATKITNKVTPVYPHDAKLAHVQGVVSLLAVIGKDGSIQNLHLIIGPALLVDSAREAVKQWTYQPTLLNGQPVEVVTQIDVNYTLAP